jgi:CBS domain-containing protein
VRVEDVMTQEVSYCVPGTNAAAAAEIMWTKNCGSIPVVDDDGHVAGMVTDRDLFIALGTRNQRASDLTVGEIMNRDLAVCAPEDDIRGALKTMAQSQSHRLPVVDKDGVLKGILSIDDVIQRAEAEGLSTEVVRTMKALCVRPNQQTAGA